MGSILQRAGNIRVDPLQACAPNPNWRWDKVSHLHVLPDTPLDFLHSFAHSLGLQRRWFQEKGDMPHYDLTPGIRARAVRFGAHEVTLEEVVDAVRRWRSVRQAISKT